jgi:hypothetical protein
MPRVTLIKLISAEWIRYNKKQRERQVLSQYVRATLERDSKSNFAILSSGIILEAACLWNDLKCGSGEKKERLAGLSRLKNWSTLINIIKKLYKPDG